MNQFLFQDLMGKNMGGGPPPPRGDRDGRGGGGGRDGRGGDMDRGKKSSRGGQQMQNQDGEDGWNQVGVLFFCRVPI